MKKITHFGEISKAEYSSLLREIEAALKVVGDARGLQIKFEGGGRYTPDGMSLTTKIQMSVVGANGEAFTKEKSAFLELCDLYNLQKTDLGKKFKDPKNGVIEVIGLNTRKKRFPIVCRKTDGGIILFPAASVKAFLQAFPA